MKIIKILCLTLVILILKPDRFCVSSLETGLFAANGAQLVLANSLMKIRHKHKLRKEKVINNKDNTSDSSNIKCKGLYNYSK
jgi:hypothetical protein